MSATTTAGLPAPKEVRDLLERVLGRAVVLHLGSPVAHTVYRSSVAAVWTGPGLKTMAVAAVDLPLAVALAGARELLTREGVHDATARRQLDARMMREVSTVMDEVSLLVEDVVRLPVRLYKVYAPEEPVPTDVAAWLQALGRRLDLRVQVEGYGFGQMSLVWVPAGAH